MRAEYGRSARHASRKMSRWATPLVGDLLCADARACRSLQETCDAYRDAVAASPDAACAIAWAAAKPRPFRARLRRAAARGDLRAAKWLCASFEFDFDVDLRASEWRDSPFELACEHGHLDAARWFADRFPWTRRECREAFWSACICADGPGIARWLHDRYRFERREVMPSAVEHAYAKGTAETLRFLDETFACRRDEIDSREALLTIVLERLDSLSVLRWLHGAVPVERRDVVDPCVLDMICQRDPLEYVRWVFETFDVTRDEIAEHRWRSFAVAFVNPDAAVPRWLHDRLRPTPDELGRNGLADVFCNACARPNPSIDLVAWVADTFALTADHAHRRPQSPTSALLVDCEHRRDALISALLVESFACADWIVRRFGTECVRLTAGLRDGRVHRWFSASALRWTDANLPSFADESPSALLRCARGLEAIDWLVARFGAAAFERESIAAVLYFTHDLPTVKRLASLPAFEHVEIRQSAFDTLETWKWCDVERGVVPDEEMFLRACRTRAEDVARLEWMHRRVGFARNIAALRASAREASLRVVQWVVETFGFARDDVLDRNGHRRSPFCVAIAHDNLRVARWMFRRFNLADAREHVAECFAVRPKYPDSSRTARWVKEAYGGLRIKA